MPQCLRKGTEATAQGGEAHAVTGRMSAMALTEHHICICMDRFWKVADNPALKNVKACQPMPDQV
jgi:hypothetical protein